MNDQYRRQEYTSRINRVMDYIEQHIDEELSLEILAEVSEFSRYHFHRIFGAMVGETLNQFIQRVRIEKAAVQLVDNPKKSITDIAFDCGFSGSASFSRAFRDAFEITPSQWRQSKGRLELSHRKIRKMDRKNEQSENNNWKDFFSTSMYYDRETNQMKWRIKMKETQLEVNVEVKEIPDMHVAYVRHIGPYQGNGELFAGLFNKLMTWAGPRGLLNGPDTKCMSVYHDNPEITEEDKLRLSVCVTVPEETAVEGEIGKMVVQGGKYAIAHFEIETHQYPDAWNAIYGGWLPKSGYQPDDRLCFEHYLNSPEDHPENKHIVDIYVPVKPL
jgi:AraC family transcriptional regulator